MALGSTQPLTEMSTRCTGGKGGQCVRLTTLPPSCAVVMKFWNLNFLEHSGPLQACNGTALPLYIHIYIKSLITSHTTQFLSIRKTNHLTLCKEIIDMHSDNCRQYKHPACKMQSFLILQQVVYIGITRSKNIFQNCSSYLKTVGASIKNLVAWAIWCPGFVHSWLPLCFNKCNVNTFLLNYLFTVKGEKNNHGNSSQ